MPQKDLFVSNSVPVPSLAKSFVARNRFRKGLSNKIRISSVDSNFKKWFGGLTVEPHGESELDWHKLMGDSSDRKIIEAFGGEARAETNLAKIWCLLIKQNHGQSGPLLNDGSENIFYVRDCKNFLRTVIVLWDGRGWRIGAYMLGCHYWNVIRRVFIRNPEA